jgi:hypothetical protein
MEAGCTLHVSKPVNSERLYSAIGNVYDGSLSTYPPTQ